VQCQWKRQLQDCGSWEKLQSEAWSTPTFSSGPGPSGGEASEGAAGLDRTFQPELQHLAETASFFSEPRAERGEGKRRSCWAGSHPPTFSPQAVAPCWVKAKESAFASPEGKGELKPAALGTRFFSCGVECSPHVPPCPAGETDRRQARELLGWSAHSKPKYITLPTHFPRDKFRVARASRHFCMCVVPDSGARHKLQSASWRSGQTPQRSSPCARQKASSMLCKHQRRTDCECCHLMFKDCSAATHTAGRPARVGLENAQNPLDLELCFKHVNSKEGANTKHNLEAEFPKSANPLKHDGFGSYSDRLL
jgi:hypothetical protein